MTRAVLLALAAALLPAALPAQASPAALTALTRQVFVAESSFAATMAQRDSVAFARFVAPDAIFFGEKAAQRGKSAVVERWSRFFAGPDAPFSWRPEKVEVLDSAGSPSAPAPSSIPRGIRSAPSTPSGGTSPTEAGGWCSTRAARCATASGSP